MSYRYDVECPHCKRKTEVYFSNERNDHKSFFCLYCLASLMAKRVTKIEVLLLGKPGLKEDDNESNMQQV